MSRRKRQHMPQVEPHIAFMREPHRPEHLDRVLGSSDARLGQQVFERVQRRLTQGLVGPVLNTLRQQGARQHQIAMPVDARMLQRLKAGKHSAKLLAR